MSKRYSASFRIYSDEISPDEMTRLLGVDPSLAVEGRRARTGLAVVAKHVEL